ncbi:hypothetical protein AX16_007709 [Volvariella volvacea WC 439]|nr:hypothetical protein AX16_007709 [Volvariella volvacea WC 439]
MTNATPPEQEFWRRILGENAQRIQSVDCCSSNDTSPSAVTTPASIFTLPEEILVEILHCAKHDYQGSDQVYEHFTSLIRFSHVCRVWRSIIATSMPTAWSTILVVPTESTGIVRLVELSLIRTGTTCLLNIAIDQGSQPEPPTPQQFEATIEILNLILSHADRWHTVDIALWSKSPPERIIRPPNARNLFHVRGIVLRGLEPTSRDQIWDAVNSSPELRKTSWILFVPASAPWSQLEKVDITIEDIPSLEDVLPRLINLAALTIGSSAPRGASDQQVFSGKLIPIPLLRVLHLTGSCLYPLLDRIKAPLLQELLFHPSYKLGKDIHLLSSIHTLLTPSKCHLVSLDVRHGMIDRHSILTFLHQSLAENTLNALETFILHCGPNMSDEVAQLLTVPIPEESRGQNSFSRTICLPSLRTLSWHTWIPKTHGLLGAMLESRFNHGSLKKASIRIRPAYNYKEDYSIFESLKERGFNLKYLRSLQ